MPAERRRSSRPFSAGSSELAIRRDGSTDQVVTVVDLGLDDLVHAVGRRRGRSPARPRPGRERSGCQSATTRKALDPEAFADLLKMESSGQLSATQSKEVLAELMDNGGDPGEIAKRLGYEQLGNALLESMVEEVIASNPEEWRRYTEGDDKVAQFLLGQVMKASKGRANGKLVAAAFAPRRDA